MNYTNRMGPGQCQCQPGSFRKNLRGPFNSQLFHCTTTLVYCSTQHSLFPSYYDFTTVLLYTGNLCLPMMLVRCRWCSKQFCVGCVFVAHRIASAFFNFPFRNFRHTHKIQQQSNTYTTHSFLSRNFNSLGRHRTVSTQVSAALQFHNPHSHSFLSRNFNSLGRYRTISTVHRWAMV